MGSGLTAPASAAVGFAPVVTLLGERAARPEIQEFSLTSDDGSRFYIDGDKEFPTICGTGTEDYFCGAYNFDGGVVDDALYRVLTLVQIRPDGPRRHDVVIYEVSRGGLGSFSVDLPPGLAVETVGTDEGEVVPAIESRRLPAVVGL